MKRSVKKIMYMLYKHKYSPVLRCASQTSRNEVKKITLDVGSISSSPPSSKSSDIVVLPCKLVELLLPFVCKWCLTSYLHVAGNSG